LRQFSSRTWSAIGLIALNSGKIHFDGKDANRDTSVDPSNTVPREAADHRAAQVRKQLDRVLSDEAFSGANRRSRLLRYLVEETLEDRGDGLKESVIAAEVFDRAPDYDPQVDSVVRVEVGRLRSRLAEYYDKSGRDELVRIEIPKGSYRPVFEFREDAPATPEPSSQPARRQSWRLIAAWAGMAAALAAGLVIWRLRVLTSAAPEAIAVLPFLNLSGNSNDEYLGDGITDELTEVLAEFNDLRVVARTSAFQYKGKSADVREIGRNLRVGALLEGSVARTENQVRVIAQLIRTSDGYHLWSHTYETTLTSLPEVETGIANATREKLARTAPAARPTELATRNPEAHDLYIRAVYVFNQRTRASTEQALDLARQAAEKDASFAQPYVLMAAAESQLNTLLAQSAEVSAKHAWEDVAKALAIDPGNSGAHAQKAILAYTDQWDWPQAEREFRLALATGSHGSAENLYGWCLMTRGRFEESRRRLQAAAELDPLSLGPQLNQVEESIAERKDADAKGKVDEILRVAPGNPIALILALRVAFLQKDCASATAFNQQLVERYPNAAKFPIGLVAASAACGNRDQTAASLNIVANAPPAYLPSLYQVAGAFAIGNDPDRAMSYLQMSAEHHEPALMDLKFDRAFESLRKDPRFIALERMIGVIER